jgi:hypothetical protein
MKKNDLYKRAEEAFKKLFGDRYDEGRAQGCVDKVWDENNPEGSMSRLDAIIGRTEARMKASQNFDALQFVKTQLFDAPTEVKASFNEVVKYFDDFQKVERETAKFIHDLVSPYVKDKTKIKRFEITDILRFTDIDMDSDKLKDIYLKLIKDPKKSHIYNSDTQSDYDYNYLYVNQYKQPFLHIGKDKDGRWFIDYYRDMYKYLQIKR